MRKFLCLLTVPALAGCLTASMPETSSWMVSYLNSRAAAVPADRPVVRVSQLVVRTPYDMRSIQVMRADGTLATDALNLFPAVPSQMLKGAVLDAFSSSGAFSYVVNPSSAARADCSAEVAVIRMALDCREPERRRATVSLLVRIIDGNRKITASVRGEAESDAADGDYGAAFSRAFTQAIDAALAKL